MNYGDVRVGLAGAVTASFRAILVALSLPTGAAGRTSPATGRRCFDSDPVQVRKAGVYAQVKRGGLRLRSQSLGMSSWFQVALVTLRIVCPPVRTILAAKSIAFRRRVVA